MVQGEARVDIPIEAYFSWVLKESRLESMEMEYEVGPPRLSDCGEFIEVNVAFDSDLHPAEWIDIPRASQEWVDHDTKVETQTAPPVGRCDDQLETAMEALYRIRDYFGADPEFKKETGGTHLGEMMLIAATAIAKVEWSKQ